ncbi:antitoxin family protein [Lamprocystis purpurea]|jgi:predicted DNA-binding antitoxin AbrB/MazE fold protein|uniref:antitoxin family protein n=1 Tax=Lamprocystis purpurea TaxID=61598 RepID=UPI000382B91D|nr:antitoxin family protein [Lamprocystis purpurea]
MTETIEALYDGEVFRPTQQIALAPNTRVRVIIENLPPAERTDPSFLHTARAIELEAPSDWSENVDVYLYGGERPHVD